MSGLDVSVVTLFPELVAAVCEHGVTARAAQMGALHLTMHSPRDFAQDRHRTVDGRPFGGGPGMVGCYEPWVAAIRAAKASSTTPTVVLMSPQGERLTQTRLRNLAERRNVVLVSARYEGLDERIIETEIDMELSLGDYVLSGGELAAMAIIDGMARLVPGVLGSEDSAMQDSFSDGLLEGPQYTRPASIEGQAVPAVLQSGDHAAIARWRREQQLLRSLRRRPDLIDAAELSEADRALIDDYRARQAVRTD